MERKIADIIVIAIVLMIILPIVGFAATGTVITESLNLRKEASTESGIVEILNNNDDGPLLKSKLNKNGFKNLFKSKKMSKTQNYFYNKMKRETYNSPLYVPFKSHREMENKVMKKNFFDLSNTNSLLKFLNYLLRRI